jgi:hypothetical protein
VRFHPIYLGAAIITKINPWQETDINLDYSVRRRASVITSQRFMVPADLALTPLNVAVFTDLQPAENDGTA